MNQNHNEKYCSLLMEVKRRTEVAYAFISQQTHAIYLPTTIESACLQVRKILELIAFGSLVVNNEEFFRQYGKPDKLWRAKEVLEKVGKVNPEFYPEPIIQTPSDQPGVKMEWTDRGDDYLNKEKFVEVYDKCSDILHTNNPFRSRVEVDYDYYKSSLPKWMNEIVNLLNAHLVKIVGNTDIYLFQMGDEDSKPNCHPFKLFSGGKP